MAIAPEKNKGWKTHLINWIGIPGGGGFLIGLFTNMDNLQSGNHEQFLQTSIISTIFWSVLANGNGWIIDQIDKKWTWLDAPVKRTVIGILAMVAFSISASLLVLYTYITFYFGADFLKVAEANGWFNMLAMPLILTAIIALWGHGRAFLLEWRQAAIDVERLKNENLRSKFESMKSQINPHFLFNSLNALSSLVYDNQDHAAEFIQKLSEVYRYVLDRQNDEVVALKDELNFLNSYIYLNKIRFGDSLRVNFHNCSPENSEGSLPPLALQMVVENAIKHNEVSKDYPLSIDISKNGACVDVINNLNPVKHKKSDSNGLGLKNIRARYQYLSDQRVEAKNDGKHFSVQLPILTFSP